MKCESDASNVSNVSREISFDEAEDEGMRTPLWDCDPTLNAEGEVQDVTTNGGIMNIALRFGAQKLTDFSRPWEGLIFLVF